MERGLTRWCLAISKLPGVVIIVDVPSVIQRVNAARAVCSCPPIDRLPKGERRSPCFCPLGRALRKDLGDSFFLAVGTQHLRVAAVDGDAGAIASRIRQAWGLNEAEVGREGEQFVMVRLPPELRQFVIDFDAGKLPQFEGKVDQGEVRQLHALAKHLWDITIANLRAMRSAGLSRKKKTG